MAAERLVSMCNDYARELELGRILKLQEQMGAPFPMAWSKGRIPNEAGPTDHIKISEKGVIVRAEDAGYVAEAITWAWKGPNGKPVFNFKSDGRSFADSRRLLILAAGFYEYTPPANPKVKLKDQHFFTMAEQEWFWIAGIEKHGCFTMLTTAPGPDIKPYHDRQICVLEPKDEPAWLKLSQPEDKLLLPLPVGSFAGEDVAM